MAKEKKGRIVGVDLGKRSYVAAFLEGGKARMSNGLTNSDGRLKFYRQLRKEDTVALESGAMSFMMAKEMERAVGCKVIVLHPSKLAVIYRSMKKTDKEDALKIAHLVSYTPEEHLPTVALPSDEEMRRRELLSENRQTKRDRSRAINELHGLFTKVGITTVVRKNLATEERRAEAIKMLGGDLLVRGRHYQEYLRVLEAEIVRLKKEMSEAAKGDGRIERLETVPGVGDLTAFAFTAYVDVERFDNAGQVSNYLGLVPRVDISGDQVHYGHITKRGNGYARGLLNQASWALVRSKAWTPLKAWYLNQTAVHGKSKKKAIVGVSRKLVELMYALLRDGEDYDARRHLIIPPKERARTEYAERIAEEALEEKKAVA